jgi:hypothetical protein
MRRRDRGPGAAAAPAESVGALREASEGLARIADDSLEGLQQRFPAEWRTVGSALVAAAETRRPEAMVAFMDRFRAGARPWRARLERQGGRTGATALLRAAAPHLAMDRMARLAAEVTLKATAAHLATGQSSGTLRFGRLDGWLIDRLFFARRPRGRGGDVRATATAGLARKPVSLRAFRWLWPLVRQRRILMPLCAPRGIYCFYTRELVCALGGLIGARVCLEIAAGDGTLARFLSAAGTPVTATDDRSWSHAIAYPDDVEMQTAPEALSRRRPAAVVCSFPPPQNTFERHVFRTSSVELYIVITSRHRHAAGDWNAYAAQTAFDCEAPAALAALVLPPELDPAVLVFRRRAPAHPGGRVSGAQT